MLFNSFEFVIFFATFLVLFFASPRRARPALLLIASYIFYAGWRPSFLVLLLITTLVDYSSARIIDSGRSVLVRRIALIVSLTINCGLLGAFKYLDFILSNIVGAAGVFGVALPPLALHLILPVGISFYTFQSVGYVLDVYNRRFPAEKNLLIYALYVAFFPQLVAGPIERASHMIAQYKAQRPTSAERIATGLWLVGWGLFKKICVADLVSSFVSGVYADPTSFNGAYTLIATFLFALQIYCDFSGYSDIAIGIARIMGFDLMINFRQPYLAASLTEFWRRWHISLCTWFRDYLYVPLGGNRTTKLRWVRNILVVFGVSGIWHGASWTFLIWGLWHGAALVVEDLARRWRSPAPVALSAAATALTDSGVSGARVVVQSLGMVYTLAVVMIGWVFFRAQSLHDALYILKSWTDLGPVSYGTFKNLGFASVEILVATTNVLVLLVVDSLVVFQADKLKAMRKNWILSILGAVVLFYDIVLFGAVGRHEFIYFQF
jgi:D-alanyl-lipoteichoic acid acyltransferase DltB (MBOAT superfamily)